MRLGLHGTNTKEMNTQVRKKNLNLQSFNMSFLQFELFLIGMSQAYDEIAREQGL